MRTHQWDYDGGTATGNAPNNISVSWNTLGEKEITLIIVDRGCESSPFTQTFINGSQPQSMFTLEEQCFQVVDFTNLSSDVENVSISFEWDFGDGNLSNEQQLTHTYQTEGSYNVTLSVENEYGCKDVYSLIANVIKSVPLPELALPNILTPNGDGINDMYELPVQVEDCYEYEILFYNRWGQLVFRQTENSDYFNGKSSGGAELSAGVYFVMLKSKEVTLNSTITLVR
jgi:gliding motility-associated-like protein